MATQKKAVIWLRIMSAVTMILGAVCVILALKNGDSIPLFPGVRVPGWVIGASVIYIGLRYWRRIPEMERNLKCSTGFSWTNFKFTKTSK
jgi:hypothetical protein